MSLFDRPEIVSRIRQRLAVRVGKQEAWHSKVKRSIVFASHARFVHGVVTRPTPVRPRVGPAFNYRSVDVSPRIINSVALALAVM